MPKSGKFLDAFFNTFKSHSRKDKDSQQQQQQREVGLESVASREQRHFSFERIVAATQDFDTKNMLGRGGFGPVFKGKLEDGREIAVKMLSESSNQGEKEFINEARLLAGVQHRNVVNLVGYCAHAQHKLLIYEYVARESIDKLLFDPEKREQLDWKKRYDIIVGITRGLLYLHEGAHCCIIHRDIKASNILLDDRWVPKIADFGMARLYTEDHTYVKTRLAGTNGYMAPEYVMHGSLSIKADVFSFGILVLEIISGKKISNFISEPDGEGLLEWAWNLYKKNRSLEIIDPKLASTAVTDQVRSCIKIGFLCTERDPRVRPTMERVLVLLSKKPGAFEEPVRPGFLRSRNWGSMGSSSGESSSQAGSSSHHSSTSASASASASTARTSTTTSTFTSPRRHHSHSRQPGKS